MKNPEMTEALLFVEPACDDALQTIAHRLQAAMFVYGNLTKEQLKNLVRRYAVNEVFADGQPEVSPGVLDLLMRADQPVGVERIVVGHPNRRNPLVEILDKKGNTYVAPLSTIVIFNGALQIAQRRESLSSPKQIA